MESASISQLQNLMEMRNISEEASPVFYILREEFRSEKWFAHSPQKKQLLCVYLLEI